MKEVPIREVLDHVIGSLVLSDEEIDEINSIPSTYNQMRKLLDFLHRKREQGFKALVEALKDNSSRYYRKIGNDLSTKLDNITSMQ